MDELRPATAAPRGRGSAGAASGRFERLRVEPDPEADPSESPSPKTEFFIERSRSTLSRNHSPDIPFAVSLNPYRGCEHGCSYCLTGDTLILMGDGNTRKLEDLRAGDEIYGTEKVGHYRRYVKTKVLDHWRTRKLAYRVRLEDGTSLVASGEHRFLTARGWKHVVGEGHGDLCRPHLTLNDELRGIGGFAPAPEESEEYRRGYLCGIVRGDGLLRQYTYHKRPRKDEQYQFRLAQIDHEGIARTQQYLRQLGVQTRNFAFKGGGSEPMLAIRTNARASYDRIRATIQWPGAESEQWSKGFLAGIFDAEGSFSQCNLRITNTDEAIISATCRALKGLGFDCVVEPRKTTHGKPISAVRVRGGLQEHLRFFHTTAPAIMRKRSIEGTAIKSTANLRVAAIEPLGIELPMFDITTGTGDFIANGVVSHNCYARPYHEYVGMSPGLDFESKILVKLDAPELLRRELSAKSWTPEPIAMSGVTDCYQPVERRLRLTRACLEVLAEFRNPVMLITKNHLVARDVDVLAELASHKGASVSLSITTLDGDLQRRLEPRTSHPSRRLEAISVLAKAGVPVGVMAAPMIPGLNDHELPGILKAAADAGASFAAYLPLRLPHAVKDLFQAWLDREEPGRKAKVLRQLRDIRGGRLNDPDFGSRFRGKGALADELSALFKLSVKKYGLGRRPELDASAFRRPAGPQLELFGGAG